MNSFVGNLTKVIDIHFQNKTACVEQLSSWLSIGKDAIYRRLRNETPFTFDEVCIISEQLNLSLDILAGVHQTSAFCDYNFYDHRDRSFSRFLEDLCKKFERIIQLKDAKLYYASKGLPFFIYLNQPQLLAFKLFVWDIGSWNIEKVKSRQFDFELLTSEEIELARRIFDHYCQIPSYEIWNNSIVNSSLEQIEYLMEINLFKNKETIIELLNCLRNTIHLTNQWAEEGQKMKEGKFQLYNAELFNSTNNVIYLESKQNSFVSWTFCDPDYLSSHHQVLCKRASNWINNLIRQANNISEHSLRIRRKYFLSLHDKINSLERAIDDKYFYHF